VEDPETSTNTQNTGSTSDLTAKKLINARRNVRKRITTMF